MDVHIAGYSGGEKNILFSIEDGELKHDRTEVVSPGQVLTLSEDAVHAVSAVGDAVIIGSAIVEVIESAGDDLAAGRENLGDKVRAYADATRADAD